MLPQWMQYTSTGVFGGPIGSSSGGGASCGATMTPIIPQPASRAGSLDARHRGSEDTAMLKLSAFADEISPDLEQQIQTCKENRVTHFDLRGVDGKNVMDFDDAMQKRI